MLDAMPKLAAFALGALVLCSCGATSTPMDSEQAQGVPFPRLAARPWAGGGGSMRLCSWNVRKLGHGATTDFGAVAGIVEGECDAAVVLEVMQKNGEHPGYAMLSDALGPEWAGVVTETPRPNTTSANSEFYAMVWRTTVLAQCQGWDGLRFIRDHDGSTGDSGVDHFSREPAFGCFRAVAGGAQFDFLLAAFHATWAGGDSAAILAEARGLDAVAEEMAAARPGENDIFVLGDFNLVPARLAEATTLVDWTTGQGSTLNRSGAITTHLYDHVLVRSPELSPELRGRAEVLDVRDQVASPELFYRTVSDHLPIRVRLEPQALDDD